MFNDNFGTFAVSSNLVNTLRTGNVLLDIIIGTLICTLITKANSLDLESMFNKIKTLWDKYTGQQVNSIFIEDRAKARGVRNLKVITSDMNDFRTDQKFNRIVSVEMFEHMRNYAKLFELIHGWLEDQGQLFFHVFCHKDTPYFFQEDSHDDWMAKNFFSGGVMPAFDLPSSFPEHLSVLQKWRVNGKNYAKTAKSWLERIDKNRAAAKEALALGHNPATLSTQLQRWRLFLMACEELFAYRGGNEWFVGHYLCEKT